MLSRKLVVRGAAFSALAVAAPVVLSLASSAPASADCVKAHVFVENVYVPSYGYCVTDTPYNQTFYVERSVGVEDVDAGVAVWVPAP